MGIVFFSDSEALLVLAVCVWTRCIIDVRRRDFDPLPTATFQLFSSTDAKLLGFSVEGSVDALFTAGRFLVTCRLLAYLAMIEAHHLFF